MPSDRIRLAALLAEHGCVAADDEADELLLAAGGCTTRLALALARRLDGEPLAWVCGSVEVDGLRLGVEDGVYVPRRWQTPAVARAAAALLPAPGVALDLCTGAGAVAALLRRARPLARVIATDIDPTAVRCALANGIEALEGDLFAPVPSTLLGDVDVVTAVAPYVPTSALTLLPRDTAAHEPRTALDGGPDGLVTLRRILAEAPAWLLPGGSVVLEHGIDQAVPVAALLDARGFVGLRSILDADGDPCGTSARTRWR